MKRQKTPVLEFVRMSPFQSIWVQARVNGGQPVIDPVEPKPWKFPDAGTTWFSRRLQQVRKGQK